MFKVCVVVPSWHYWTNPFKLQPMWEMYYATVLESQFPSAEVGVQIKDLRGIGPTLEDAIATIPGADLYFYWIMKSGDAPEIYSIVSRLKERFPTSRHAAGGTHVDVCTQECRSHFDAVITGPGEESLRQLVTDLRKGAPLPVYAGDYGQVHFSNYPHSRRSFLPESAIVNTALFGEYGGIPATSVQFSRGCVFRCAFCVYNLPNQMQTRRPDQMEAELAYLKREYGVRGINLRDEICLPVSPKVSTPFLETLGKADVVWRGQTTVKATREQLKLARQTGCVELSIGVETVSEQVLSIIDKRWQNLDDVRAFIATCREVGIKVKMCLIFGLPGEPPDILEKTHAFLEEVRPDYVSLSGFCPVPGSPIHRNPAAYGVKSIDRDWSKHAHLLYRFSNEEEVGLPFEYEKETPWGPSFSREQIKRNMTELQGYLRSRGMSY